MRRSFRMSVLATLGLALLAAVTFPKLQGQRRAAELFRCRQNLEKLGIGMRSYHKAHGSFPSVAHYDAQGRPLLSWRVLLLPHLGEQALFDEFHMEESWDSPHNRTLVNRMPEIFRCPFDRDVLPTMSSYVAVSGAQTMFPSRQSIRREDISDDLSLTVMLIEIGGSSIPWTKPEDLSFDVAVNVKDIPAARAYGARHVLLADGSVTTIVNAVKPSVWQALLTINDGESISASDL